MKKSTETKGTSRRGFIGTAAAALAAPAAATTTTAEPVLAAQAPPAAATGIDVPALRTAQTVAGMQQTDEALGKAASLVARYRAHIETLRGVDVPTDVEPAFSFNPRRTRTARAVPKTAAPPLSRAPKRDKPASPTASTDIAFAPVSHLRAWLDAGEFSSEQLVKLSLDRLERHDAALSCVVTLGDERSLAEAKRADAERRAGGPKGPLHGIPYGAKDLFDSAGIRTLWGARPYRNRPVPTADATAIDRLKTVGACLTAKLSTGELAIGDAWSGEPQFQSGRSPARRRASRDERRKTPGIRPRARAARPPAPPPRWPRASCPSPSAPRPADQSSPPPAPAASWACVRPTAGSAGTE
jgi:hypothetical protein